ncbi:DEAD/DEAH box helicase family protein [Chitinophaga polysaccharea]|uniref:DEAD/DEAH box helicase family protein n=1 Tax=Chitinophaga polysaccharea TaxID=1293035 RepID=UPI00115A9FAA|nr:DEAD/DEAH box helicase family protein [Chitinophaga polysaccharea]
METTNSPVHSNKLVKNHFRNQALTFDLKNTPIDYFKLEKDLFNHEADNFTVSVEKVNFGTDRYLEVDKHLEPFDYTGKDTTVFNFQTGRGKSSNFYDLIEKYVEGGYYVIVCSPFQKLVEKDYTALKARLSENNVFNYLLLNNDENLTENDFRPIVSKKVQVMTINCLLQNPGKNIQDQALVKRNYLKHIKQYLTDLDKKVVLFFDELHDSIEHFKNEFLRNLFSWKDLIHKCFVSSATYNFASIPVIQYLSVLTDCKIKIYEADRQQIAPLANLHLHITSVPYGSKYLSPLNYIKTCVDQYKKQGRKINILTGHKTLITELLNTKNDDGLAVEIRALSPNILTGETNNSFSTHSHNIGTAFKTGIDLREKNSVLIVVLPAVKGDNKASYGIFTDGASALIQAISRVRNGGDIHIFMYEPPVIIDIENHKNSISPILINDKASVLPYTCNAVLDKLIEAEDFKGKRAVEGDSLLDQIRQVAPEIGLSAYTINNYLLDNSTLHAVNKYPSIGKFLSPYVLWAAINNQFGNAQLRSITYQTRHYREIRLNEKHKVAGLMALLDADKMAHLKKLSYSDGLKALPKCLEASVVKEKNSEGIRAEVYFINQIYHGSKLCSISTFGTYYSNRNLYFQTLHFIKTGSTAEIEKDEYIRTCVANAANSNGKGELLELLGLYKQLAEVKNRFIEFVRSQLIQHSGEFLLHKDYDQQLPDDLYHQSKELMASLKSIDQVLARCFNFYQTKTTPTKKSIAMILEMFTNITGTQKSYNGEKGKYYLVNEPVSNDSFLKGINFLV